MRRPPSRALVPFVVAMTFAMTFAITFATPADLASQQPAARLQVTDPQRNPIPFAAVILNRGQPRVANDSGIVTLPGARDSLKVLVRRVGFAPYEGWVRPAAGSVIHVTLDPLAQGLAAMTVSERANTPLARTGFYERLEQARRGAFSARFITPEELDLRNPIRVTQMLGGENFIRVVRQGGRAILSGRGGGCPVTVLLDGNKVSGMVEEYFTHRGQEEIREHYYYGQQGIDDYLRSKQTVDEIVNSHSVAAIEIYASANSAPGGIQLAAGAEACAIVAIWTGSRQ